MNTTDNQNVQKTGPSKEDIKQMKAEYIAGSNIDTLSQKYNYTALEVEEAVVEPVSADDRAQITQAEIDAADAASNKSK